jgi:hypothetical protein
MLSRLLQKGQVPGFISGGLLLIEYITMITIEITTPTANICINI